NDGLQFRSRLGCQAARRTSRTDRGFSRRRAGRALAGLKAETCCNGTSPGRGWSGLMMAAIPSTSDLRNRTMSKKKSTSEATKITAVKKGEIYENKHKDLIEITNGRLKDEGNLGMSFEGK